MLPATVEARRGQRGWGAMMTMMEEGERRRCKSDEGRGGRGWGEDPRLRVGASAWQLGHERRLR